MASVESTIVAISTPPGRGGIGIVRLSGAAALDIAATICAGPPRPGRMTQRAFTDDSGQVIDHGLVLAFRRPASYTGEDVVELHAHGSPLVLAMLVSRCVQLGARLARPGEFSERAFLNGRIDLTQAEAVADLIDSTTQAAARAAVKSLQGEFSRAVAELAEAITQLRIFVEAAIDFPEEEIDFLARDDTMARLQAIQSRFAALRASISQGQILRDGLKVVLTGLPNAGKSSLLNALAQEDRAIVSSIAGTTRDLLHQDIALDGLPLQIIDSAGMRDGDNEIEREGIRRARAAQQRADLVLLVIDWSAPGPHQVERLLATLPPAIPVLQVRNKIDLIAAQPSDSAQAVYVSALTGRGLANLRQRLKEFAGYREDNENVFIARQRHIEALNRAEACFTQGLAQFDQHRAGELLAEELAACHKALGEITGAVSSDDLLGLIFSSFCIGK